MRWYPDANGAGARASVRALCSAGVADQGCVDEFDGVLDRMPSLSMTAIVESPGTIETRTRVSSKRERSSDIFAGSKARQPDIDLGE